MDFKVCPMFIEVITLFWDDERMVFQFGDVKITPTIEEIKDCLDCIGTRGTWKHCPDHHILLSDRPTGQKLRNMLLLVNANWLNEQDIPLKRFFKKWGNNKYFSQFPRKFHNYNTSRQTQVIPFCVCLLGTMVFPRDEGK